MAMTNVEIVATELELQGKELEYDGTNLFTFQEWKMRGKSVIKGQKAYIQCSLWKPFTKKVNGKDKKVFFLKKCSLFTSDQVELIQQSQTG